MRTIKYINTKQDVNKRQQYSHISKCGLESLKRGVAIQFNDVKSQPIKYKHKHIVFFI